MSEQIPPELWPAWLVSLVDQRMALIEQTLGAVPTAGPITTVITALTEPPEGSTNLDLEFWERACDACSKYCRPNIDPFYTGHVVRLAKNGTKVAMTLGVCETHKF